MYVLHIKNSFELKKLQPALVQFNYIFVCSTITIQQKYTRNNLACLETSFLVGV